MKKFRHIVEDISRVDLKELEKFADRLLDKYDIDIEFTRHFADRLNDARNRPSITVDELKQHFNKIAKREGKALKTKPKAEVVLKDIQTDLNLPVVIDYDSNKNEFEVTYKTAMRKKDFKTRNKVIRY